jgi:hypothetical protein
MGYYKRQTIQEDDMLEAEFRANGNLRIADVLDDGGDTMINTEIQTMQDGPHHVLDALERDFERNPVIPEAPVAAATLPTFVGSVTTEKRRHGELILEGVCSECAHCGMTLTDAVSIERGLGPICSKKGYMEDPVNSDEMQALIDLAEYQDLVDFLMKNYKPQGVRGLMNGLVRVASLNRKLPVFQACCDAIESLGYRKMAAALRQSLAVIEVRSSKHYPGYLIVWVKRNVWNYRWSRELENIYGTKRNTAGKGMLVLLADGKAYTTLDDGTKMYNKPLLWSMILRHFENYIVKTDDGAYKVTPAQVNIFSES